MSKSVFGLPIQKPLAGELAHYQGIYYPSGTNGCVLVRVARTRRQIECVLTFAVLLLAFWFGFIGEIGLCAFGVVLVLSAVLPAVESWQLLSPADIAGSVEANGCHIEFEGLVSSVSK